MRENKIREYGRDFVESWEEYWAGLGYRINYSTGLLERINHGK